MPKKTQVRLMEMMETIQNTRTEFSKVIETLKTQGEMKMEFKNSGTQLKQWRKRKSLISRINQAKDRLAGL